MRNLYYNNGYVFNNVEPVEMTIDGDSIDLEMRVSEGRQATFNRVNISGNTRVYENVIRRELRTKPGDLFSMEAIKRSVMDLSQMNQFDPEALGKAMSSAIKPDPQNGTVDISYPLTPKGGDQFQISAGWGPTGIIGTVGVKFTNFSIQNLFKKGARHRVFLPQGDNQNALDQCADQCLLLSGLFALILRALVRRKAPQPALFLYFLLKADVSSFELLRPQLLQ